MSWKGFYGNSNCGTIRAPASPQYLDGSTSELFPITRCDRDRDSARDRLRESDALCA